MAKLASILASTGASIKEVSNDRHFGAADIARVVVTAVLETRDFQHIDQIREVLHQHGIDATVE